jgi:thymidylate kinase
VRQGFLTIARDEPDRVRTIDATAPVAEITALIVEAIFELVAR